jgi:hypothetical protein
MDEVHTISSGVRIIARMYSPVCRERARGEGRPSKCPYFC